MCAPQQQLYAQKMVIVENKTFFGGEMGQKTSVGRSASTKFIPLIKLSQVGG
jgi:hypothetical protein